MNIHFENVDFRSRSGPNGFGLKLARSLHNSGHTITGGVARSGIDVNLAFIQSANSFQPTVLRLDGIYFNADQAWKSMNDPIRRSYEFVDSVVVQSEFNRELTRRYFGDRDNVHVIHNGTDTSLIENIPTAEVGLSRENVWMCASTWRPHKRLHDNIKLFRELSKPDDILLVAGALDVQYDVYPPLLDPRIKFLGDLTWENLISCMKAAGKFVHLAWLDHCPNVVVDARACGCHVYCSSTGGTEEIAGSSATVLEEEVWNFEPIRLYDPPKIVGFDTLRRSNYESTPSIDINSVAYQYLTVMNNVVLKGKPHNVSN